jgi:long-chain acyl-CoA synthetase
MLVADLLYDAAQQHPDRAALIVIDHDEMTFAQWESGSNRLAQHLLSQGLNPGERVALLLGNEDASVYLSSYVAIHKAGGVAVPCNTRFTSAELAHVLTHSGARMAVVGDGHQADLHEAGPQLSLTIPAIEARRIAAEGPDDPVRITRSGEDLADILYTSGTTGTPKGVACTHDNISFNGASTLSQAFGGAHFLHAVPLFTFAGTHAMSLICLRGAMTQVLLAQFDPGVFLEALAHYKVQLSYAVPAMILRCLAHPRMAAGGLESLKLLMYGTAPMPPHAITELAQKLPGTFLLNLYGLTEGGAAVCSLPPHEALNRPNSIGRPLPPTQVRITDKAGQTVPAMAVGEICLKAPIRNRWYYKDEAATAQTWDTDGWLKTGDLGYLDEDGYLYLVDRIKDLIIVGGHNVSAPEVEGVLIEHPAIQDAAVVGVHHPVMGEVPKGFVVLHDGATVSHDDLQAHLTARLAPYKVPRDVDVVPELPRNALGKVLKRVLRGDEPAEVHA